MGYIRMDMMGAADVQRMMGYVGDMPQLATQALQAGADVLLPAMQDAAPIGPSGGTHIRDRLEIKIKGGAKPSALVGVWGEPVAYYVEYGHGGPHPAPAHPYMQPTADAHADEVLEAIMDTIDNYLAGAGL